MLYELTVIQFSKMLTNLDLILDKAAAYAEAKKFNSEVLLNARLAPDQFHLIRQVQIACDTAKLGVARLTGKTAPVHEDNETSVAELKARIHDVLAFLSSMNPQDFEGAKERSISQPRWEGKYLTGFEYAVQHAVPNLYFHITTAYAILRHNGVDLGKKDYLGAMPFKSA
ncbi:DUF1993 family protein [Cellvibrio sp. PSBB006]|uniref:DUF1993 domain-containing protein n=1 Tax=Cellvibrio sp. PSBB006 TaxID=1987723 RepID=UPI000B3B61CF|nr:DUF1993 domain-containing protein [Cellvibrio sp. PSBB006]ARU29151.1 hypothetical protein CBR65_17865 [Cellvibrio sp. PSBB006]